MYNSFVLSFLSKIGKFFDRTYKNSIICNFFSSIKKSFARMYYHSKMKKILESIKITFISSFIYKFVVNLFDLLDYILNGINNFKEKLTKGSVISEGLGFYGQNEMNGLRLFYETFIIVGVVLLILNFAQIGSISIYINIALILIGVFGLLINGREIDTLKTSLVFNFFYDLFKLDEGGENWW